VEEGDMATTWPARALHLVDIDNLLGDPATYDELEIGWTICAYKHAASFVDGDHVVVATSPFARHALAIGTAWPGARHVWRKGKDGADLALLESAAWAVKTGNFGRVVIGSGDHIFVDALEWFAAANVPVQVVSRRDACAGVLWHRAAALTFLLKRVPA
jgi:hypothetical protein